MSVDHGYPYPNEPDRTHWEGCYRSPKHHNCAVAEVDRLRRQLDTAREALQKIDHAPWEPDATCGDRHPTRGLWQMAKTTARRTLSVLDGEDKADG